MTSIKMKPTLLCAALVFSMLAGFSQEKVEGLKLNFEMKPRTGMFSFYWGYNRAVYSKTDLHFSGANYDFTVYDVVGKDKPTPFGTTYIHPAKFSVPQYVYRLGFNVSERVTLSVGLDHMKYVMDQDQVRNISGVITPEASEVYQGTYLNQPISLSRDFLRFEHTDGFNLVTFDVAYSLPLLYFSRRRFRLNAMAGIGGVWVVTKTKVAVMEFGIDNFWHMSGYTLCGKAGLKLEYKNRWFAVAALRGGYSSLFDVLINENYPDRADHNLSYLEGFAAIGTYFRCWKPKK